LVFSAARPRRAKCAKPKPRGAENQKVTVYAFTLIGWPFAEFCASRLPNPET